MKARKLIELLTDKIMEEGSDVEVLIYDNHVGEYRGFEINYKYSHFLIDLSEDISGT